MIEKSHLVTPSGEPIYTRPKGVPVKPDEYHHQFVDVPTMQEDLIQRAAELFTRYITVAPPEYSQDVKQWLRDAGFSTVTSDSSPAKENT